VARQTNKEDVYNEVFRKNKLYEEAKKHYGLEEKEVYAHQEYDKNKVRIITMSGDTFNYVEGSNAQKQKPS